MAVTWCGLHGALELIHFHQYHPHDPPGCHKESSLMYLCDACRRKASELLTKRAAIVTADNVQNRDAVLSSMKGADADEGACDVFIDALVDNDLCTVMHIWQRPASSTRSCFKLRMYGSLLRQRFTHASCCAHMYGGILRHQFARALIKHILLSLP